MKQHTLFQLAGLALLACSATAQAQTGFTETFGNDAARVTNPYVNFTFAGTTGVVENDHYAVMPPQGIVASTGSAYWADLTEDHTGDAGGALMVLNAGNSTGAFYARDFDVQAGRRYRVTAWRYVVNADMVTPGPIAWRLDIGGDAEVGTATSGNVNNAETRVWESTTLEFDVPQICATKGRTLNAHLDVSNQTAQTGGNDLYVDDISVTDIGPVADTCPQPAAVPALDTAGVGLLGLLSAGLGALALRRRNRAAR